VAARRHLLGRIDPRKFFRRDLGELLKHAEGVFRLSQKDKDGISLREHYEQVEKTTGIRPHELDVPPLPETTAEFWAVFLRLHRSRQADAPVAFSEVLAYSRLTGRIFTPLEVDAISELDALWHQERAKKWQT
jgi:hypothetical protein